MIWNSNIYNTLKIKIHKAIILPVVNRNVLKLLEDKTLRQIFGSELDRMKSGENVTKRHFIAFNVYIIRYNQDNNSVYYKLTDKPIGGRHLGKYRRKWE